MNIFKKILPFLLGSLFFGSIAYAQSIPSQSPWFYDGTSNITQIKPNNPIKITGPTPGGCLQLTSGNIATTTGVPCGTGSGSTGNVATSTSETSGFLAYWTSTAATPATLGKVATSAPTISAPLQYSGTLGSFAGGSGGAFSITQSGLAANGYLSSTDFNTFNNKISSTSLSVTTIGTSGAATYTPSTGIFNIPQYQAAGSYLTSYDAFTHPAYGGSATSSLLTLTGGLLVNFASSTFVGNATTTGTSYATVASSTSLYGAGLFGCNSASNALTWNAGIFGCNTITSGGSFFGQTWEINAFSALAPTTTIGVDINASSTIGNGSRTGGLTVAGGATTTGVSFLSGNVGIGTQSNANALNVNGTGSLSKVTSGSGFAGGPTFTFTSDTTSGLFLATSPAGIGISVGGTEYARFTTQNFGVGTTSPGSLLSVGNTNGINFSTATSTFNSTGGINLASGCYAIGGVCLISSSLSFSYPFPNNATSTTLTFNAGLVSVGSTTINGNATTTGTFFATTASSTNLFGAGLFACSGTSALTWTGGTFGCAAQPQGTVTQVNTTYPVTGGSFTTSGTIALAFGTTTSNTWANTQTFTNSPVFSTLGAGTVNALANGTIYNTSTSTPSVTAPITYSGTLGQFIGGSSGSFGCATCLTANQTITLTGAVTGSGSTAITTAFGAIAQGVLANAGVASAVPVSTATSSLGIALSDTTGTLAVTRGGTGVATLASGGVLFGNGASAVQVTTSGAANTLLAGNAGAPTFTGAPTVSGTMTAATFTASAANSGGGFIFHSSIASSSPSFIFQDSLNAIWGQVFSDGTTGSFKIYTGNGSNTLGLTQNYLGNVAIGVDLAGLYSASGLPDTTKLVITRTPSTTIGANYYLGVGGAGGDQGVNTYRTIGFGFNSGGGNFYPAYMGYQETSNGGNTMGDLVFGTRANTTGTNVGNERMRITSAGNVGIATTTPVSRLTVNGDIGTDGAISAVSSCGSGAAMTTGSTDTAGEVTEGTLATGCTITFAAAKARAPFCTASSEAGLAFSFSQSASALTIVNIGALSSTKVDYICVQNNL